MLHILATIEYNLFAQTEKMHPKIPPQHLVLAHRILTISFMMRDQHEWTLAKIANRIRELNARQINATTALHTYESSSRYLNVVQEHTEKFSFTLHARKVNSLLFQLVASFDNLAIKKRHEKSGRWTTEEEQFANQVLSLYHAGLIHLPNKVSLRGYIAVMLNCTPMRVSKKFPNAFRDEYESNSMERNTKKRSRSSEAHEIDPLVIDERIFYPTMELVGVQPNDDSVDIRRGRWTLEESNFAVGLESAYKKGSLPSAVNVSLRRFLSLVLHCDPMRVSKKLKSCVNSYDYYFNQKMKRIASIAPQVAELDDYFALEELFRLEYEFTNAVASSQAKFEIRRNPFRTALRMPQAEKLSSSPPCLVDVGRKMIPHREHKVQKTHRPHIILSSSSSSSTSSIEQEMPSKQISVPQKVYRTIKDILN